MISFKVKIFEFSRQKPTYSTSIPWVILGAKIQMFFLKIWKERGQKIFSSFFNFSNLFDEVGMLVTEIDLWLITVFLRKLSRCNLILLMIAL